MGRGALWVDHGPPARCPWSRSRTWPEGAIPRSLGPTCDYERRPEPRVRRPRDRHGGDPADSCPYKRPRRCESENPRRRSRVAHRDLPRWGKAGNSGGGPHRPRGRRDGPGSRRPSYRRRPVRDPARAVGRTARRTDLRVDASRGMEWTSGSRPRSRAWERGRTEDQV